MASSALVGALRASLGLDTAAFEQGSKRAIGQSQLLAKRLTGILSGIGVGAAVVGITKALKSVIDHADKLGETAQKIGIPVEELSKLEYVAKLSDVSLETLTASTARLSKSLTTAAASATGETARAFQSLGISLDQVRRFTPTEALATLADRFSKLPDGARKTAIAMQLMGRSGYELIPLLNEGAGGFVKLTREATAFGVAVTGQTAAAADRFNDNLTRLQERMAGVTTQVVSRTLPSFDRLLQSFTDSAAKSNFFGGAVDFLSGKLQKLIEFTATEANEIKTLTGWIGAIFDSIELVKQNSMNFLEPFREQAKKAQEDARNLVFELASLRSGKYGGLPPPKGGAGETENHPLVVLPKKAKPFWEGLSHSISLTDRELGKLSPITSELTAMFDDFGGRLSDTLFDATEGTRSLADGFKSMANSMLREVTGLFANRAFQLLFQSLAGPGAMPVGVGPGGMGFAHFGGPRQHGGRVGRGRSFLVGERGPEMFVPQTGGSVISNSDLGGGPRIEFNVINQHSGAAIERTQRQGPDGKTIIEAIVTDVMNRKLPKQMTAQFGIGQRLKRSGA